MENNLPPDNTKKNELAKREEELRQMLLEQGTDEKTVETIIAKTRETYATEVLRDQEHNFPYPLMETHKLNREVWQDGIVSTSEMDSLLQNQSKLNFNFMIMRDLMNHLETNGDYSQQGQIHEVRDKFERLRKAVRVNETSISRAKKARQNSTKLQNDRKITLHLYPHELALVQGMLKGIQNAPQRQASRQVEYSNDFAGQRTR